MQLMYGGVIWSKLTSSDFNVIFNGCACKKGHKNDYFTNELPFYNFDNIYWSVFCRISKEQKLHMILIWYWFHTQTIEWYFKICYSYMKCIQKLSKPRIHTPNCVYVYSTNEVQKEIFMNVSFLLILFILLW